MSIKLRAAIPPVALALAVLIGPTVCTAGLPPATRLPAQTSFNLAAAPATALPASLPVEIHLDRGHLTLGLRSGESFLTATGAYEWDVDEPSLQTGERLVFHSGRQDLARPPLWHDYLSRLPRYDLLFGRFDLQYDLRFIQNDGHSDLNLAGLRLAALDLALHDGNMEAWFAESPAVCKSFFAVIDSGMLELNNLGGLGANTYGCQINAGVLTAQFGALKAGTVLGLTLEVNGGTVSLKLPPGGGFQVVLTVRSGLAYVAGQRYDRGSHSFRLGDGAGGILHIEVNAGLIRIV